jgi:hypothetical protein
MKVALFIILTLFAVTVAEEASHGTTAQRRQQQLKATMQKLEVLQKRTEEVKEKYNVKTGKPFGEKKKTSAVMQRIQEKLAAKTRIKPAEVKMWKAVNTALHGKRVAQKHKMKALKETVAAELKRRGINKPLSKLKARGKHHKHKKNPVVGKLMKEKFAAKRAKKNTKK